MKQKNTKYLDKKFYYSELLIEKFLNKYFEESETVDLKSCYKRKEKNQIDEYDFNNRIYFSPKNFYPSSISKKNNLKWFNIKNGDAEFELFIDKNNEYSLKTKELNICIRENNGIIIKEIYSRKNLILEGE